MLLTASEVDRVKPEIWEFDPLLSAYPELWDRLFYSTSFLESRLEAYDVVSRVRHTVNGTPTIAVASDGPELVTVRPTTNNGLELPDSDLLRAPSTELTLLVRFRRLVSDTIIETYAPVIGKRLDTTTAANSLGGYSYDIRGWIWNFGSDIRGHVETNIGGIAAGGAGEVSMWGIVGPVVTMVLRWRSGSRIELAIHDETGRVASVHNVTSGVPGGTVSHGAGPLLLQSANYGGSTVSNSGSVIAAHGWSRFLADEEVRHLASIDPYAHLRERRYWAGVEFPTTDVQFRELASGSSTTAGTSTTTTSVTPTADRPIYVVTEIVNNSSATPPNSPVVTRGAKTYVLEETRTWDDGAASAHRLSIHRAVETGTPGAGAFTIDTSVGAQSATNEAWLWWIIEAINADTSGTDGSGSVVQSVPNSAANGVSSTPGVTLAAFADQRRNAVLLAVAASTFPSSGNINPDGGYNELTERNAGNGRGSVFYKRGQDLAPNAVAATTAAWGAIGLEIKAAAVPLSVRSFATMTAAAITQTGGKPAGLAVGDLLVAFGAQDSNAMVDLNAPGWTERAFRGPGRGPPDDHGHGCITKIADAADVAGTGWLFEAQDANAQDFHIVVIACDPHGGVVRFRGASGAGNGAAVTQQSAPVEVIDDGLLLVGWSNDSASAVSNAPNNMTPVALLTTGTLSLVVYYQQGGLGRGTAEKSLTWSAVDGVSALALSVSSEIGYQRGFNFRGTLAFTNDREDETHVLTSDNWPTTRVYDEPFGWVSGRDSGDNREIVNGADRRLAGTHGRSNGFGTQAIFRSTLPVAGTYRIGFALGDAWYDSADNYIQIRDGSTPLLTIDFGARAAARWIDAGGTVRTANDWVYNQDFADLTFAGTELNVVIGKTTGTGSTSIAHFYIEKIADVGGGVDTRSGATATIAAFRSAIQSAKVAAGSTAESIRDGASVQSTKSGSGATTTPVLVLGVPAGNKETAGSSLSRLLTLDAISGAKTGSGASATRLALSEMASAIKVAAGTSWTGIVVITTTPPGGSLEVRSGMTQTRLGVVSTITGSKVAVGSTQELIGMLEQVAGRKVAAGLSLSIIGALEQTNGHKVAAGTTMEIIRAYVVTTGVSGEIIAAVEITLPLLFAMEADRDLIFTQEVTRDLLF